jgi:hypothetical protein
MSSEYTNDLRLLIGEIKDLEVDSEDEATF